jgi:hypothetical protein
MSGYASEAVGEGTEHNEAAVFLPKPFSVEALNRAVARAAEIGRGATH